MHHFEALRHVRPDHLLQLGHKPERADWRAYGLWDLCAADDSIGVFDRNCCSAGSTDRDRCGWNQSSLAPWA